MNLFEAEINRTMERMEQSQAYAMLDRLGGHGGLDGIAIQIGTYHEAGALMIVASLGEQNIGARVLAMRAVLATGYGQPAVRAAIMQAMDGAS